MPRGNDSRGLAKRAAGAAAAKNLDPLPKREMRPLGPAPRRRDGESPNKGMRPLGPARRKPRGVKAQSKRMTAQAQSIAMEKVAKRKATVADRKKMSSSTTADSKRKTGQAIKMLGKKKAPSSYALGLTKKQKGR